MFISTLDHTSLSISEEVFKRLVIPVMVCNVSFVWSVAVVAIL